MRDQGPGVGVKAAIALGSLLLALGVAEAVVRRVDGGALPSLPLFEAVEPLDVHLRADAEARGLGTGLRPYTVRTGIEGLRRPGDGPAWSGGWLAVGDSILLGLGVEDDQTFAAVATGLGVPVGNAGVVGYGVGDALRRADQLLGKLTPRPEGVLVVVNQANDWDEEVPIAGRFRVEGGWLVDRERTGALETAFLRSSLSHLHVLHLAWAAASRWLDPPEISRPAWAGTPEEATAITRRLGETVRAFADARPGVPVAVAFVPLDVAVARERADAHPLARSVADRKPVDHRRLPTVLEAAMEHVPMLDLSGVLAGCASCFLDGDHHLSPEGHERVGRALASWLRERPRGDRATSAGAVP